ncbi:MAG TPA: hypothetical protein VGP47_07605 [Parachlamydiaceae bacterium]|nr:hypothetical protein [Parachlamydiaceae bacterium]
MHNNIDRSESSSLYDHAYYAYGTAAKITGSIANTATTQAQNIYKKADELKNRYFTTDYAKSKASQAIRSKLSPLSIPLDLDKQIKKTKAEITFLKQLKLRSEFDLQATHEKIEIKKTNPSIKEKLKDLHALESDYTERIAGTTQSIQEKEVILKYLNTQKKSVIGGHLTFYAGWISGMAIPGSGPVVGTTLTAMNLLTQQNSVNILPKNKNIRADEQKNVNFKTLFSVAYTVSSVAVGYFVIPIVKESILSWAFPANPF